MDVSIRFLILVLLGLVLVLGGSAQTSFSADDLLNLLEANLRELVKQVQANALNSCDLLSTCNAKSTCSRLTCPLTSANTAGYACQGVLQNTYCKDNCPWRKFDFSRSFLSVPGVQAVKEEYIPQRQLQEICAQRNLDSFFQKHSNNTDFFSLYFGSVTGTFRFFPGMEESDCGSYDPRKRLWYLTSTTNVKKAVMVLIDNGFSMAETILSTSDSHLAKAFRITESFLNTTTKADYVNIFTFDENNVNSSSAKPVQVTNTSSHPDFGNFTATLSSPDQSLVPPGNITDAISRVITSSAGFGSTGIPSEYLKVIILITDSKAVDAISNAALPWDLIKNNSINVFLYMFNTSNAVTNYTFLMSQLCSAQGYFQILDNTVFENPLLALEAYYSFVAKVHSTYLNSGIDYTIEYPDSSDVDNRTFTLSKAVFSSNEEFLGVAAIDIFKTKVLKDYNIDGNAIEEAVRIRTINNTTFNASAGINTTTCLNQTLNKMCNQTANISNIVCPSTFNADIVTLQNLSCCNCTVAAMSPVLPPTTGADKPPVLSPTTGADMPPDLPPTIGADMPLDLPPTTGADMPPGLPPITGADKPPGLPLALSLGLGLGILALILVAAVIAWLFRRRPHQPDEFPGPSREHED